ncbi:MAG: helix-turn-helix domain-containing protein [Deinococcus-Thermus bacterium]|jgi:DNA-binding transcriptional ArsR family regulator|nr:helix-turn-helix domain-containing protein [Deinococcota bacterium]
MDQTPDSHRPAASDPLPPEVAASAFAALGSEQRLGVLRTLVRAGPEGLTIGALGARCGVTGSTLTHHLKILAGAGLIRQERRGRSVICAGAAVERIEALNAFLLRECCADRHGACAHDPDDTGDTINDGNA